METYFIFVRLASIKQKLSLLTEAIDQYAWILSKDPDYVPALKGK